MEREGGWGRKAWENANTLESNRACETQQMACEDVIESLAVRRLCTAASAMSLSGQGT